MIRLALVAVALLAAAQDSQGKLPDWLIGRWCPVPKAEPEYCNVWQLGPDGALRDRLRRTSDGAQMEGPESVITVEDGYAVLRGSRDGKVIVDYREIGRGPGEILFENRLAGDTRRVRFRRAGAEMTEELFMAGRDEPTRYHYRLAE